MLISDRDIRALVAQGKVVLDPWDPDAVQPASVDIRLDRYFRLFDNHKYRLIDPSKEQTELTRLVDTGDKPLILHPESSCWVPLLNT